MSGRPPPRGQQIVQILVLLGALVGLIVTQRRCAHGVGSLFQAIDARAGDGGSRVAAAPIHAPLDGGAGR